MNKRKVFYICSILFYIVATIGGYRIYKDNTSKNDMQKGFIAYQKGDYHNAFRAFINQDLIYNPEASFIIGAMYFAGQGVAPDKERAIQYYEKAALMNYAPAMTTLAILYSQENKYDLAERHAVRAAEKGDVEAQMLLASWYEHGNLPVNYKKAEHYYELASKQGDFTAKNNLAMYYRYGRLGVRPNLAKAMRLQGEMIQMQKLKNKLRSNK